ncbi:hypothetical protein J1614_000100 [Plenodomus biglobosus]|nr:hypothetical protein J1614_000100 [Plenodomus biglobosus]
MAVFSSACPCAQTHSYIIITWSPQPRSPSLLSELHTTFEDETIHDDLYTPNLRVDPPKGQKKPSCACSIATTSMAWNQVDLLNRFYSAPIDMTHACSKIKAMSYRPPFPHKHGASSKEKERINHKQEIGNSASLPTYLQ